MVLEGASPPHFSDGPSGSSVTPLAITMSGAAALVPVMAGTMEPVSSVEVTGMETDRPQLSQPALMAGGEMVKAGPSDVAEGGFRTPQPPTRLAVGGGGQRSVVNVNENIISLLLKLHSKLSGKPDSYIPLSERGASDSDNVRETASQEYRDSRIGDGCFFIEKVSSRL